jgi:hypothetical protein
MKHTKTTSRSRMGSSKGFAILWALGASMMIAGIAGLLAPYGLAFMEDMRVKTERGILAGLKVNIEDSFQLDDINSNISFSETANSSINPAHFDSVGSTFYPGSITLTAASTDWRRKLVAQRGVVAVNGTYASDDAADASQTLFNAYGVQRLLIPGPLNEASQQRYLLISVLVPPHRNLLSFPAAATFDDIWNNRWDSSKVTVPASWAALLSADDFSQWNAEIRGRTNASRVIVERIVQKKFTITVNNTHATDFLYVYVAGAQGMRTANLAAPNPAAPVAPAWILPAGGNGTLPGNLVLGSSNGSGITQSPIGFLAGRTVNVFRGPSATPTNVAVAQIVKFRLNDSPTLWVQAGP